MALEDQFPEGKDNGVDIDKTQFRIRSYNPQYKILMDTYEGREDKTLDELKIYPYKMLALEKKPTLESVFVPYDPNKMEIKINVWVPTILQTHVSMQDYVEGATNKVRVARDMPLLQFKSLIETMFGYKDAVIMRRTPT